MLDYQNIKVLIVEDNHINQKLIMKLMAKKGYDYTLVDDGRKAVEAYETGDFHIILMDIQMPVLDGYLATQAIREKEKHSGTHIPIIGITAFAMSSDRQKCLDIGMDEYLSKPFNKEDFYNIIETQLKRAYGDSILIS